MLTHDDMREMHFERERRRMSEVRLSPEGKIAVTPICSADYPIAEQTAIASDCIRECTAYLKQLQEFYLKAVENNHAYYLSQGVEGDGTGDLLACVETLTESIAKIIDRLPVGERKP